MFRCFVWLLLLLLLSLLFCFVFSRQFFFGLVSCILLLLILFFFNGGDSRLQTYNMPTISCIINAFHELFFCVPPTVVCLEPRDSILLSPPLKNFSMVYRYCFCLPLVRKILISIVCFVLFFIAVLWFVLFLLFPFY